MSSILKFEHTGMSSFLQGRALRAANQFLVFPHECIFASGGI